MRQCVMTSIFRDHTFAFCSYASHCIATCTLITLHVIKTCSDGATTAGGLASIGRFAALLDEIYWQLSIQQWRLQQAQRRWMRSQHRTLQCNVQCEQFCSLSPCHLLLCQHCLCARLACVLWGLEYCCPQRRAPRSRSHVAAECRTGDIRRRLRKCVV